MRQWRYPIQSLLLLGLGVALWLLLRKIDSIPHAADTNGEPLWGTASLTTAGSSMPGKALFSANCASCHALNTRLTGPALAAFRERGPWKDSNALYLWIENPTRFAKKNHYVRQLIKEYGTVMSAFPNLTHAEIDAIADYINVPTQPMPMDLATQNP